jgi:hypothetical protein
LAEKDGRMYKYEVIDIPDRPTFDRITSIPKKGSI